MLRNRFDLGRRGCAVLLFDFAHYRPPFEMNIPHGISHCNIFSKKRDNFIDTDIAK
nr:MAG TPA_asm: hypothetical protein [Caudoviricetes sp.]